MFNFSTYLSLTVGSTRTLAVACVDASTLRAPVQADRIVNSHTTLPKMKTHHIAIAAIITLQLGGCYSYYQPPAGENIATLSIKNATDRPIFANTFKNNDNCSGGTLLMTGDKGIPAGSFKTIEIAPNTLFSYFVSYHTGVASGIDCFIAASFTPKPNRAYRSEYFHDSTLKKCTMNLKSETENGFENERSLVQREWLKPFIETSSRCK